MVKKIILALMIFLLFPCYLSADGYKEGYSEWSEIKTGNYGEIEATQYGYCLGTYQKEISDKDVVYDVSNEEFYKKVYKYTYVYHQIYETRQFEIVDTKANQGIVWSKYLDGYHLTEIVSDIDMANANTWGSYKQPRVDLCDDSGLLFTIQYANNDIKVNGKWTGDIIIKGTLYMYAYSENTEGRNWTGAGGSNYIKCYKKETKTSNWVYSYKDIKDLKELINEEQSAYVLPKFGEGKGWRFEEPYENSNGNVAIKAISRKVYSYPLGFKINYYLDGGEFIDAYPSMYYVGTVTDLTDAHKLGYDFIGWYLDSNLINGPITKIDDTYKGDINLFAKYKRKGPLINIDNKYIYKNNRENIDIDEIIQMASASDELDGDISEKIYIEKVEYLENSTVVNNPKYIETNLSRKIIVTFSVYNSGFIKASISAQLYILTSGEENNIQIYSRYINSKYLYTLNENSRWKDSNYAEVLNKYIKMMEE